MVEMAMRHGQSRNRAGEAQSIEKPPSADIFTSCGFGGQLARRQWGQAGSV